MNALQHCTLKCFAAPGERSGGDLECCSPLLLSYQFFFPPLILPFNTASCFSPRILTFALTGATCGAVVRHSLLNLNYALYSCLLKRGKCLDLFPTLTEERM